MGCDVEHHRGLLGRQRRLFELLCGAGRRDAQTSTETALYLGANKEAW